MKREDFKQIIKLRSYWKIDRWRGNYMLPTGEWLSSYIRQLVISQLELDKLGIRKNGELCYMEYEVETQEYVLMPSFKNNEYCTILDMDERITKLAFDIVFNCIESQPVIYSAEKAQEDINRIKAKEQLFEVNDMNLDIPQHFTKGQGKWIKKYCIQRNIEFYNKAIDDFVKFANTCPDIEEKGYIRGMSLEEMADCCKIKFNT